MNRNSRRKFLSLAAKGSLVAAAPAPWFFKNAFAADDVIKIGVPTTITGTWASIGVQVVRTCKLWERTVNASGGINGKKVQILTADTQGDPANCLRKVEEMVNRDKIGFLTGVTVSSEALAVMPKLADWNVVFIASINGAGSITAKDFVPNTFRSNISSPMGARTVARWLEDSPLKDYFSLGLDYVWGHSSVEAFEKQITAMGKTPIGHVFAPTGTKDYSTYITRIRQANPQGLYLALTGNDAIAFFKQAKQYNLLDKFPSFMETLELSHIKSTGEAIVGLMGSSRYPFTYDNPVNNAFVKQFQDEYKEYPDTYDGDQWQALQFLAAALRKAKSEDSAAVIKALEGLELDTIKGHVTMRACDHQAVQQGFIVRVTKKSGFPHPVPEILKVYPADSVTPGCRKDSF